MFFFSLINLYAWKIFFNDSSTLWIQKLLVLKSHMFFNWSNVFREQIAPINCRYTFFDKEKSMCEHSGSYDWVLPIAILWCRNLASCNQFIAWIVCNIGTFSSCFEIWIYLIITRAAKRTWYPLGRLYRYPSIIISSCSHETFHSVALQIRSCSRLLRHLRNCQFWIQKRRNCVKWRTRP